MLFVNADNSLIFFFFPFSYLIALTRTSSTMSIAVMKEEVESFFQSFGESFRFFSIEHNVNKEYFINALYHVEEISLYS